MQRIMASILMLTAANIGFAAETTIGTDDETGWLVHTVTQGQTKIRLVPAAGCNVYSIEYAGRELLKRPKSLKDLPGFMYGNPVLYPMPNRVRDAELKFGDKTYKFEANNGKNFLHGLVHSAPWEVTQVEGSAGKTTLHCRLPFQPGTKWYEAFPHKHVLKLDIIVTDGAVRFAYTVDNTEGDGPVPFGFAYHPWFLYQGPRAKTFLTIPATHWMEAEELLPTGKLVPLAGTKFDLRQPRSLEGFVIDDVYYGLAPEQPTVIDFREAKLKLELAATPDFTHLVVYTPQEPWFCVENQTCATDAHNLFARGLKKESHLLIVEPGKAHTGYAEFRFKAY
jgi:aldose 1-epimerase